MPGGRFSEIYYWDSYFTMLGLQQSGKTDLIQNMAGNFGYLSDTFGFIPNGSRTYYLGRSQPPFFSFIVNLLSETNGRRTLVNYPPQLQKEYDVWIDGRAKLSSRNPAYRRVVRLPDGFILNRYYDDRTPPRPESYKEDALLAQKVTKTPLRPNDCTAIYGPVPSRAGITAAAGLPTARRWPPATPQTSYPSV